MWEIGKSKLVDFLKESEGSDISQRSVRCFIEEWRRLVVEREDIQV
jgi:hypothetical protein